MPLILIIICMQENHVVDGSVKWMQEEREEVVDGKVDWKGRKALKHKHGGMKVSLLVLGKIELVQYEFMNIFLKSNMKMKQYKLRFVD